jgi:hypothetical protein
MHPTRSFCAILNTRWTIFLTVELARCKTTALLTFLFWKNWIKKPFRKRFILASENSELDEILRSVNIRLKIEDSWTASDETCTFPKSDDEVKACKLMMIRYGINTPKNGWKHKQVIKKICMCKTDGARAHIRTRQHRTRKEGYHQGVP